MQQYTYFRLGAHLHKNVVARWQHLNSSLERVNAVHDGQASSGAHGEAGGGLLLNALHEVSASQGWIGQMTQRPMSGPSIHAGMPSIADPSSLADVNFQGCKVHILQEPIHLEQLCELACSSTVDNQATLQTFETLHILAHNAFSSRQKTSAS